MRIWTDVWYELTGELGLMETDWLNRHFSLQLFRLGRLQFCMGQAEHDIPAKRRQTGIQKGMPVLEIHIPAGEPLDIEKCRASIEEAKVFFTKHFPAFQYEYFTCHSWMLDPTLKKFLGPNSNILAFQKLFEVIAADRSDAILKYMFRWDATRENISQYEAKSILAKKIKVYIFDGGTFYEAYGVFPRNQKFG